MSTRAASGSRSRKARAPSRPDLLAFVEQEGDRPRQPPPAQQCGDLEHRRDADAVVGRARPGEGRIVMRDEEEVPPFGRADRRDEVAHPRAADRPAAASPLQAKSSVTRGIEARRARISAISRARTASPASLSTGCGRWSPRMRSSRAAARFGVEAVRRPAGGRGQGEQARPSAPSRRGAGRSTASNAATRFIRPSLVPRSRACHIAFAALMR